jgi:O-succinylbenzoic acid--CoA ligase
VGVLNRRLRVLEVPTGPGVAELLPALAAALAGTGPALLPVAAGTPAPAALAPDTPLGPGEDDPDDPTAVVVATSGSTGRAKGVLLPASALAASAAATEARLGGPGTWLLALPAQHIAGLQVLLRSAAAGTSPHVLDTAAPFTPARFVAAAGRIGGRRRYVSLVPTQLHRLLADAEASAAAATFDAVLVGGAAAAPGLLERARAEGVRVVTTYGMSETCGGCVYDGRPLDPVRVALDGGRITLSGPVVARGYRGRPGEPAFARPGTFVTDDAGVIGADGALTVTGRLDELIVSGGVNVAPALVEAALSRLPGIAEVVVVGVPDPEWGSAVTAVVVPPAGTAAPDLAALRRATAGLPAACRPRRLLVVDALPLRGPGKPDRRAIGALAAGRCAAGTGPAAR